MRNKIEFTEDIIQYIIDCYNSGKTQTEIKDLLESEYNIKCSEKTLYRKYKEIGLNGNKKKRINVIEPWYNIFTNDIFPDKIGNCILLDLGLHYTLEEISKKHNIDVDTLKSHIKINLNKKIGDIRLNYYLRLYDKSFKYTHRCDLINLKDEDKEIITSEVNRLLDRKYHIIKDYEFEFCNHKYKIDFYCPEKNVGIIGDGEICPILSNMNVLSNIDPNAFHSVQLIKNTSFTNNINNEDRIKMIYDYIVNNVKPKFKVDRELTESELEMWELKREFKHFVENFEKDK